MPFIYLMGVLCVTLIGVVFSNVNPPETVTLKKSNSEFVFAAVGDYGTDTRAAFKVAALVKSWQPDFVVSLGDNDYNHEKIDFDTSLAEHVGPLYGEYMAENVDDEGVRSIATSNRFWPAAGNHDRDSGSLAHYTDYFNLPNNERYYDVRIGDVHLFVINGADEPDGVSEDSVQAKWIKDKLMRSSAPWKIVNVHFPPFSSGKHGSTRYMRWPFEKWGATAVLSGHDHIYERLHVAGIHYFVNGAGGEQMYPFGKINKASEFRYNKKNGAMKISGNRTAITFAFFNTDGKEIDRLTIDNGEFHSVVASPLNSQIPSADSVSLDGQ